MPRAERQPDRAAAAAAARHITGRRAQADDPDLARLPDDLLGVVDHVHRCHRVPPEVLHNDVVDALRILDHLRRELDRHRLAVLRVGLAAGMTYTDLTGPLGVGTRQGVEAAIRRLESAVAGGTKDERPGRVERKRRRNETTWLARNSGPLRAFTAILLANRDRLPDIADDIDDLAADLAEIPAGTTVTPGVVARLRLLLREARATQIPIPADLQAAFEHTTALLLADPQAR